MKKLFIALLASVLVLAIACKPKSADGEENATKAVVKKETAKNNTERAKDRIYNVKVMKLNVQTLDKSIPYTATLTAFEEVHFASASPGRIDKIFVEVGDHVKKGQKIAEMDKTQLKQAKIQYDNAKINLDRLEALRKTNSISEQQYDQVKTQYDVAQSSLDFLEENTKLLAPISGVVTGKYFEDGEMYSGAPNTQVGKAAIVSLMQIDPLKAIVNVSEANFPNIYVGMPASVSVDVYSGKSFQGKVYRIHPTIDPMSRTFKVEVSLDNKDEKLRPGMFSRVNLSLGTYTTIVVPSIAVMQQEGTNEKYVYIHQKGVAHKIVVKTGKRFDEKLEIISDKIKAGQELIVAGQGNLMDNYKVKILD